MCAGVRTLDWVCCTASRTNATSVFTQIWCDLNSGQIFRMSRTTMKLRVYDKSVRMYVCMDGWMNGWMDVGMWVCRYGCMDVWMYVWLYGCMCNYMACMHVGTSYVRQTPMFVCVIYICISIYIIYIYKRICKELSRFCPIASWIPIQPPTVYVQLSKWSGDQTWTQQFQQPPGSTWKANLVLS